MDLDFSIKDIENTEGISRLFVPKWKWNEICVILPNVFKTIQKHTPNENTKLKTNEYSLSEQF